MRVRDSSHVYKVQAPYRNCSMRLEHLCDRFTHYSRHVCMCDYLQTKRRESDLYMYEVRKHIYTTKTRYVYIDLERPMHSVITQGITTFRCESDGVLV